MTPKKFRQLALALALPEAIESEHMGHPDFRVRGKIFATLNFDETFAVLMLTPEQQEKCVRGTPKSFTPVKGGWGLRGCTQVELKKVGIRALQDGLRLAWNNKATKSLAAQFVQD